jgi:hypothetical protein
MVDKQLVMLIDVVRLVETGITNQIGVAAA